MSEYSNRETGNKQLKPHPNCKLTPEVQETICHWISKGNYISRACQAAGISDETLRTWVRKDREGDEFYLEFLEALKKAEAQASVERIARIQDAAKGGIPIKRKTITRKDGSTEVEESYALPQWQADAWTSERKEPQDWGQKVRVHQQIELSPELERYHRESADQVKKLREAGVIPGEFTELPEPSQLEQG